MTLDEFFDGADESRQLFDALRAAVESIGAAEVRVTKSQISFRHRKAFAFKRQKAFAWAWMPGKYLRDKVAPLVLTLALTRRDPSPRWKQVVEPAAGRFTHHLEIYSKDQIDDEVRQWLEEAWLQAG